MKKIILACLFTMTLGLSYAHFLPTSSATILSDVLVDNNPRGLVLRKKVKYKWELEKTHKPNQYLLKIHKEHKGKSNLAYATTMLAKPHAGGYMVKIFHSVNNSYRWDMDVKSFIKVIYKGEQIDYQVTGVWSTFEDNNHGLSESQFKDETDLDPRYKTDFVRYASAAIRYFVFKYPKAMIR